MNDEIHEGDIVQIVDESHAWFPCLLVVSEVKSWGVVAYAFIPQKPVAQAFNRLESKQIYKVGVTAIGVA